MKHIVEYDGSKGITHIEGNQLDNSQAIENSRKVLEWRAKNYSLSRRLDKELTGAFGKHNRIVRGEFVHKVWILSCDGINYNVWTSNRGTSIEIIGCPYEELFAGKFDNKIIAFLEELRKKLM